MVRVDRAGDSGQYSAASPRRYRGGLLGCALLAAGMAAGLFAGPRSALAACAVTAAPNVVTCASTTTTNTTNTNAGTASSSDREQKFTTNGAVTATVSGGATVDGFGLAITNSQAAVGIGDITFTNNGAVTVSPGNTPNHGGGAAVNLNGSGGTITYTGNGSVSGVTGIFAATLGSGAVTVTSGAVNSTGALGIMAQGIDGLVTVNAQGAMNASNAGGGINASSGGIGGVTVTTTAAGSINALSAPGIQVLTTGTAGNVSVTTAGVISSSNPFTGQRGIDAEIVNTSNIGTLHITANADVTARVDGIYAFSNGRGAVTVDGNGNVAGGSGSNGIFATQTGNGIGSIAGIHVGGSGNTTVTGSGGTGISATITGANNAGNVLVDRSGAVSGDNDGIVATTAGNGTVTVTSGVVTTTNGDGILASGVNGLVTVTGQGAINASGSANGIVTSSSGTGGITVTTTAAGTINTNGDGIDANSTGTAGNVSVTTAGMIGGGTRVGNSGIDAEINNFASTGTVHVTANADVSAANFGIIAGTTGSGTVTVTAANNVTGASKSGIETAAVIGLTTVNINGGTTQGATDAIHATATSGDFAITNNATIQNLNGSAGRVAFTSTTGINNFINNGTMTGNVSMTAGTTTFNNTGVWNTLGTSTFSGGTSAIVNSGTINAPGTAAFNGLTTLTNQNGATINLAGGATAGLLSVSGNVILQSGSIYQIQVNPTTASQIAAGGTATLGGSVHAMFVPGSYMSKIYTIVSAGSVSGTFASLVNGNMPAATHDFLSYDASHAYLNLILDFGIPGGLNGNQQQVGNALTNFFNSTGGIPSVFAQLNQAGLTQASGETATGSQQTTIDAMTQFMGVMTDPFITGRGELLTPGSGATPYAEEDSLAYAARKKRSAGEREAYGLFAKAPIRTNYDPHWSVWAAGFGGSQSTDGNPAVGSNNTTSRVFGVAAGADYVFSPRTIAGFAIAGGGTNFSVVNGGTGRSDLFQVGAFVRHTVGAAYVTAAAAYGWQDVTTDRTVTIAGMDQLRGRFNANAFSGRVEGGYRFVMPWMGGVGITPYAAGQFTTFDLPAYAEQAVVGSNTFALAYGAKSVTAPRTEIGVRSDRSFALTNAMLTLRGRLAWAHDYDTDRSIGATFQTLPGASFVVNGAAQSPDKALTTASAEMKWINGWSAAATFEGEFSDVTTSYAGKGVVRYAW